MESLANDTEDLNFNSLIQEENLLSANTGFDEEGFDDVFIDDAPSTDLESPSGIPIRPRKTSDVIDSIGEFSPSSPPSQRQSSLSATWELFSSATSEITTIVPGLNETVRMELTTDSIDLGYSSPGARSNILPKEWFRTSVADLTDALPFNEEDKMAVPLPSSNNENNSENKSDINPGPEETKNNTSQVVNTMPVHKYSDLYNMDHEFRGIAVIINQEFFDSEKLSNRTGSHKDVEELTKMFYGLGFTVVVWNNLNQSQIIQHLSDLALHNHSANDCLAMAVLSHGIGSTYIHAKDMPYSADILWNTFTATKCTTLAGKPKLFFVQACRGDKLDHGVVIRRETVVSTEVDSSSAAYKIPSHADFLITYSAYEGHYSFRHPEDGTWFIQSLCKEVAINDLNSIDFLSLMTCVSRRVALEYESNIPDTPWMHGLKQIPTIHSNLIRKLYMKSKSSPPPDPRLVE